MKQMNENLLSVKELQTRFRSRDRHVYAVNKVSFDLKKGETLGVVGESGCGKSVSMMSLLKLLPNSAEVVHGQAFFKGQDLLHMNGKEIQKIRGSQISMIFQDPMTSFNPVLTLGDQLTEPLIVHRKVSKEEATERVIELLRTVGISDPASRIKDFPHQFSGGMRQRAMIAMALACEPDLVIADEPTTALDVTIQAQILQLVKGLRTDMGLSIIWITHDLSLVAGLADRIIVMYSGRVVEEAVTEDLFDNPAHPYTQGLLLSLPAFQTENNVRRLSSIPGAPPDLKNYPNFCPFYPRCDSRSERCSGSLPELNEIAPGHRVACFKDIC